MTLPRGYTGPNSAARDPVLVMSDPVAQNLLADLIDLHEQLLRKLDHDIELAAHPPAGSGGRVRGGGQHDQMLQRNAAVQRAQRDRTRQRDNALRELRRVKDFYQRRYGLRLQGERITG